LLLQKKVTKVKESGKDNRSCFSPIAHSHFPLQKTGRSSRLFRFAHALLLPKYYYFDIYLFDYKIVDHL